MSKDTSTTTAPRLKTQFKTEIVPSLQSKLELKNKHQVPELEKIVINVGLGRSKDDKAMFEAVRTTLDTHTYNCKLLHTPERYQPGYT